ncbi:uncharacterized protein LOC133804121 [Humulus lupulus]|uniref:uncharacterized protein LOC133804121 n=1 Tax=Humulus lupulus TaxID=3486 RepID=UPI002B40D7F4|nr:uncharacterized protein LOC133804121 [Humulus lupulus]
MDSGNNSGSLQSSSTGDEEYDSRAESNPGNFLNPNSNSTAHFLGSSDSHHHYQNQQQPTLLFDHLSTNNNYLKQALFTATTSTQPQPISNPNFFLNLDCSNNTTTAGTNVGSRSGQLRLSEPKNTTTSTHQLRNVLPVPSSSTHGLTGATQFPGPSSSGRSSKKRNRASRRAPTTVLTTDTSNFRATVQEFTGIPAPPFSSGGYPTSFSRCRLDLFGGAGILPDPFYPLRPSAQKPKTSSFLTSSNSPMLGNNAIMVDIANTTTNGNNNMPNSNNNFVSSSTTSTPSLVSNHTPISDHDHDHDNHHDYHLINPSFNVHGFGTKPQGNLAMMMSTNTLHEDLSAGQGYRAQDGTSSLSSALRRVDDHIWRDGTGCKLNYAAAAATSSEFNTAEKAGLEMNDIVSSRSAGEGPVDSWIFPSE